jgi:hypothetical protein
VAILDGWRELDYLHAVLEVAKEVVEDGDLCSGVEAGNSSPISMAELAGSILQSVRV